MPFEEIFEDNKGIFVFLFSIFLSLILISINIFTGVPLVIKQFFSYTYFMLIGGSFAYLIYWSIKTMWEKPDLESWEWFLYIGIIAIFLFMFLMPLFANSGSTIMNLFNHGG